MIASIFNSGFTLLLLLVLDFVIGLTKLITQFKKTKLFILELTFNYLLDSNSIQIYKMIPGIIIFLNTTIFNHISELFRSPQKINVELIH